MPVLIAQFAGTKEIYCCVWIHTGQGAGLLEIRRAKGCAPVREWEFLLATMPEPRKPVEISFPIVANEVWF